MTSDIELSVATYNIHKSVGADRRRDPTRTAAVIAEIGADILALQEADLRFGRRTGLLNLDALRRDQGLIPVPVEETIGEAHGHRGNVILVRDALVEVVHQLDLPGLEPRGALVTDLNIRGHSLRVIATHFGLLPASRVRQSKALLAKLQTLESRPTLLMGDLNEMRVGERSSLWPLTSYFSTSPNVRSFPARFPLFRLDRIMVCPQGELTDLMAHCSALSRTASDHLPVRARLRFRRSSIAAPPGQAS